MLQLSLIFMSIGLIIGYLSYGFIGALIGLFLTISLGILVNQYIFKHIMKRTSNHL